MSLTFNYFNKVVEDLCTKKDIDKVNLYCIGNSGNIVAGILVPLFAMRGKHVDILAFRKEGQKCHSLYPSSYYIEHFKKGYDIFVDDCIDTGETFDNVENLKRQFELGSGFDAAILMYFATDKYITNGKIKDYMYVRERL